MPDVEVEIPKDVYLPCFQYMLDENSVDLDFIWGGRDSGKSKFVAQKLTEEAMSLDYFRCLLIKQTAESIKDAQWQMIKDNAEQWQVDSLFSFRSSPLSIRCLNGNTFLSRGMDNPGKIRSVANPSHAWVEEGNQISEDAFITLITGLRSDYGRVKLYFTFNPESDTPDYADFWLYKMFFARHEPLQNFTGTLSMPVMVDGKETIVTLTYRSTHVTYHDNPYVTAQRKAFHQSLEVSNPYWYRVFTLGLWGNKENKSPYFTTWDPAKHIAKKELHATSSLYLYNSWDFNRNPQVCTVIQFDDKTSTLYIIEVIKIPNTGTDKMCDVFLAKYPKGRYVYVTNGDYSGNTPNSVYEEEVTNYSVIKNKLGLTDNQIQIELNPKLEDNRTLVNLVFSKLNVQVCPVKAKPFIFDAENTTFTAEGKILKQNRKDPAQQADVLDTVRYFINKNLQWVLKLLQ